MSSPATESSAAAVVAPRQADSGTSPRPLPPWNVILLNDDHHTYEYVVRMLQRVFGASFERAFQLACEVDSKGRAICATLHKELAELKQAQVHGFGPDVQSRNCAGSMSAIIEPALGGPDDESGAGPDGGAA